MRLLTGGISARIGNQCVAELAHLVTCGLRASRNKCWVRAVLGTALP